MTRDSSPTSDIFSRFRNSKVLDLEYVGEPWDGRLLAVGWGDTAYHPENVPTSVYDELENPSIGKITFTKADHRWLTMLGWPLNGPLYDVQVMCWAVDETTDLSLEECVRNYLNKQMDKRIVRRAGEPMFRRDDGSIVMLAEAPWDQLKRYNEGDLVHTEELFWQMLRMLKTEGTFDYWERECLPLGHRLVSMETKGLPVDVAAAQELCEKLENEMEAYDFDLHDTADLPTEFKLSSDKQMREYLFTNEVRVPARFRITKEQRTQYRQTEDEGWLGVPDQFVTEKVGTSYASGYYNISGRRLRVHRKTDKGAAATDSKTLLVHYGDDPWIEKLLALRKRETVVTTFLRPVPTRQHNGRLYGRFNQTGTKTGRLSSQTPNLQNQPARGELGHAVRSLFVAPQGKVFVHGDYSMLEPRLQAHFSQDPRLLTIFREDRDIYLETAQMIFGKTFDKSSPERTLMKTYILAMGYGAKAPKLREVLAEAGFNLPLYVVEDTLTELMNVYSTFFAWKESSIEEAKRTGHVLTLAGHKRHLGRDTNARGWRDIGTGSRQAVNSIIQGSAADVVNRTMVNTQHFPLDLLVQVHDEIMWEADAGMMSTRSQTILGQVKYIAEEGHRFKLSVPLKFEPRVVHSWAEGKA